MSERKRYTEHITPGVSPESLEKGLVCGRCNCRHVRVIYTRPGAAGEVIRRRECRHCGFRVTTVETVAKKRDERSGQTPDGV